MDGRHVPLGYDVEDRKLVVNEAEAALVRSIFERFLRVGSATMLAQELRAEGRAHHARRGKPIDKGSLYKLLNNRTYLGEAVHKGTSYPGEHEAIVDAGPGTRCTPSCRERPHALGTAPGRRRRRC